MSQANQDLLKKSNTSLPWQKIRMHRSRQVAKVNLVDLPMEENQMGEVQALAAEVLVQLDQVGQVHLVHHLVQIFQAHLLVLVHQTFLQVHLQVHLEEEYRRLLVGQVHLVHHHDLQVQVHHQDVVVQVHPLKDF
jgi:hypothetical protein